MRNRLNLAAVFAAVCFAISGPAGAAPDLSTRASTEQGVTVKATPANVSGPAWEFDVVLETHVGDLSDDLIKTATLVVPGGQSQSPSGWKGDPPGGHHRKGRLSFAAPTGQPETVELRIRRPGEPSPRSFSWRLR